MEKFSILLLDDVEQNIYTLKMMIEDSFDLDIYTALNAQDAIELLMKKPVDLILSDIQMPDIDGFEFLEYLKGIEQTKNIPVIFITGIFDNSEYKKRGYELGAIEYISKPIDDILLSSKLKVYIDLFDSQKQQSLELHKKDEILLHQSKMATMGEMIGVISHQLKQPLNVISLYCSDIKLSHEYNEIKDDFVKEFDINTKKQIHFMNDTINGFMNFFNPNKVKKEFLLKNAFDETIELLSSQFKNNNINIHCHITDQKVYGVETELEQVFLNLLINSKDAFIEKDIKNREIHINALTKDAYTVVIFEDNAGGIKEENIEKIFDPYFTNKEKGTGTGLYLVKLIVQTSFQGKIKVQNIVSGLKFIFLLANKKD